MKKLSSLTLSLVLLAFILSWSSCKKSDEPGWSDEDKASYDEVLSIQDEVSDNLDDWFQNMDSLDAINMAEQAFSGNPGVNSATINSQGIAVQYANGMRGGIFLKGKKLDYKKSMIDLTIEEGVGDNFKSIVNKRSMLILDAAYSQFSYYTDQIRTFHRSNLKKIGIEGDGIRFLTNEDVTLDRLTQLSGYGIIDLQSHGVAWPKESNITDVYYLTGETASENSSKKYWDDLKTGNIPVMKVWYSSSKKEVKYYVSPDFISNHNDFSKDTVYFYGGFCYSFLGGWPDIIDGFGDGAYLGFNWSVEGYHCANWDVNALAMLCDTAKEEPFTLEEWMSDTDVEKSYWDAEDNKKVKIHYAGDGKLTLWGQTLVNIIAVDDEGVPIDKPGEANHIYLLKCETLTNVSPLEYVWDFGDESTPVTEDDNEVFHSWSEDGQYDVTVAVKNKSTGDLVGEAKAVVKIGLEDVKQYVTSCNQVTVEFGPQSAFLWEASAGKNRGDGDLEWNLNNLVGLSGTTVIDNITYTFTATLSGDGQKLSFTAVKERIAIQGEDNLRYALEVKDYPLDYFDPPNTGWAWASYSVENNQDIQSYVTSFEAREWNDAGYDYNLIGVNWSDISILRIGFHKD